MDTSTSQLGLDICSGTSPPFFQHQFFPANGIQPSHANNVEKTNGHPSSTDGGHNTGKAGVFPRHWDMESYKWDPVKFVAERADGREEGSSEDQSQFDNIGDEGSRRASRISKDKLSTRKKPGRCNEEDDGDNIGRTMSERETPSPPLTNGHSFPGDDGVHEGAGSLSLKLGGDTYAHAEENGGGSRNGKRNRSSSPQYHVPSCQVDACKSDLSKSKDYYRRHKVCEMHSKASKAPVSRLVQRFCQQCSRFHPLKEFDEGKRSCRRRLDGHNRRRRKTQPDADAAQANLMAEEEQLNKGGSGLIGSLLNILSQLTGRASVVNAPVFDRETLLRRAIAASLEDINRTTPLWAQLLTNPHHLTAALGQQAQQLAANNNHGANVAMEPPLLLSSLTGTSPEALLLLQNSLNAQIAAASIAIQNNLGSQVHGANAFGNLPLNSPCGMETQAVPPCTTQTYVESTSPGVSPPLRCSSLKEVLRPTPMAPMQMQQLNSQKSVHEGVPALPSVFMPYQAPPAKKHVPTSGHLPTNGRMPPVSTFMGLRELPAHLDGPPSCARREKEPVQLSSGNSPSGSDEQLPSSSNSYSERKNRTRRIAMKLFERNPEELPINLRLQIDSWLTHLPSEMESYIRPGCLVLTIFVSMPTCGWTELDRDLQGSVQRLLDLCQDDFWHRGRILVQVDCQMVLIVDGEIQENRLGNFNSHPYVQSVRPFAIVSGQAATITLKGLNLTPPDSRVICAHQGKLLLQENFGADETEADSYDTEEDEPDESFDHSNDYSTSTDDETSILLDAKFTFCGDRPHTVGRCFLEVEHDTTLSNARPLIVADRFVCSELCTLEEEIELAASCTTKAAVREDLQPYEILGCNLVTRLAIEEDITSFLHELGWYLQTGISWENDKSSVADMASATRLKCLLIFSVERSWCAVVRKLFDISLANQNMDTGIRRLSQIVQDDVSLLHRAVRRKNRGMVELLLAYAPSFITSQTTVNAVSTENLVNSMQFKLLWGNLFRPDITGPAGLTPLHIAASMQDGDDIVDALTSDAFQVGLNAWVNNRDVSGHTPMECAMAGNNLRSVQLVRAKLAVLEGVRHQVFINIPPNALVQTWAQASSGVPLDVSGGPSSVQLAEWADISSASGKDTSIRKSPPACRIHARRAHFGGIHGRAFRPFLLSLVAIATVCVCVCVVIRTPPNVLFLKRPFRWEGVQGGPK